jgi:hypothetical protein
MDTDTKRDDRESGPSTAQVPEMEGGSATGRRVVVVSRAEDVELLRRRGAHRGRVGVRIDLPGLDEGRRAGLQRRAARSLSACGCNEGTVAGLIYLVVVPALIYSGWIAPSFPLGWIAVGGGFLAVLVAGKAFGLVVARLTLLRTLRQIGRAFERHAKGLE